MKIITEHHKIEINYKSLGLTAASEPAYFDSILLKNTVEKELHPCIIVAPGGGYLFTSDREGEHIATQFIAKGFSAFVLRYSVVPAKFPCSLVELSYLIKHIRDHAEEYEIDSEKIAVIGFSAGGHLAASLGAFWNDAKIQELAGITNNENKPNAVILGYPVITGGDKTHKASLKNLMGSNDPTAIEKFSIENHITSSFPPTFLWHTAEDENVPVENSLYLATSLSQENIPFEMHIYPQGRHGLALGNRQTYEGDETYIVPRIASWVENSITFLTEVAFSKK